MSAENINQTVSRVQKEKPFKYIIQNLERTFSEPVLSQKSDPLQMLIRIILSQATNDENSKRTFENLENRFKNLEDLAKATESEIAETIKLGGLANQKARVIKTLLAEIKRRTGQISLDFLDEMEDEKARDYLQNFRAIGPKTVACTLLFACHKEIFPLDTHIFRILKRIGVLPAKISDEKAHKLLDKIVPNGKFYSLHVNLIKLGKKVCRPQEPLCEKCPLVEYCDYGLTQI